MYAHPPTSLTKIKTSRSQSITMEDVAKVTKNASLFHAITEFLLQKQLFMVYGDILYNKLHGPPHKQRS